MACNSKDVIDGSEMGLVVTNPRRRKIDRIHPIEFENYTNNLGSNNNSSNIDNVKLAAGISIDSKFYIVVDGVATRLGIIEVIRRRSRKNTNITTYTNAIDNNTIITPGCTYSCLICVCAIFVSAC
jgi:hypothetical protein